MRTLSVDIETYSSIDLKKAGVYRYTQAPDFEILLIAYSVDDGPVKIIDWHSKEWTKLMPEFVEALLHPKVIKTAWNAAFERTALGRHFGQTLPADHWQCTMVHAAHLGLPLSLEAAGKVLKLEAQKDTAGKNLIKYFTMPCKPTVANGGRTRNRPFHAPEKWEAFRQYNIRDVETEREIKSRLAFYKVPASEKKLWQLDQRINDTGVLVDRILVKNAINIYEEHQERLLTEMRQLTGLVNPNSLTQLKDWLSRKGMPVETLRKSDLPELMDGASAEIRRVLEIRQELSKTSVKKYEAMASSIGDDGRIRGLLQFYGANRTGRWAGRLVQVQNLPQNHMKTLDMAREIVREGSLETLDLIYKSVPDTLSQLIRTAFIAPDGHRFIAVDFSAIEARVIAWLAGETWRLDVFKTHGKIYEASAAQMFKLAIEEVDKPLRQKGKIAELALGYGGGPNALISMGAMKMGLQENELQPLVNAWRKANRKITGLWDAMEDAALTAMEEGTAKMTNGKGCPQITFSFNRGILSMALPSGRSLNYLGARVEKSGQISYQGMDQTTKTWGKQRTYGGKLVENAVQAIARDVLADAMMRLDQEPWAKIVMHVHDEILVEARDGEGSLQEAIAVLSQEIPWAKGLPLTADGFEATYYQK
jgi:DNA polymerase